MPKIETLSAVHGIAPRSDELLRLNTDVERGRVKPEAYEELLSQEETDWLNLQTEARIDLKADPKLRWQDHLRPIVKASKGFASDIDTAPVTRWYESNTFYRQPTIVDWLSFDPGQLVNIAGQAGQTVSLITPGSFAELCDNQFEEVSAERNVLQLYGDIFYQLAQNGTELVILENYHREGILSGTLSDVQILAERNRDLEFGVINLAKKSVTPIPWDSIPGVGVELSNETIKHLGRQPPYARPALAGTTIWQTVLDSSNTRTDSLSLSNWPVTELRVLKPARLILTHDVDLEQLPLPYAQQKVRRLGEFALELSEYLETKL